MRAAVLALLVAARAWGAACPAPSNIAASYNNGQDWITWTDPATGSAEAIYRFSLYRSTSAITTLSGLNAIQTGIGYNAGIRNGVGNGRWYDNTAAQRQDAASPMVALTNGGSTLAAYTGLAVVTRTASTAYYYAVTTTSTDASCTESGVSAGVNATTSSLSGSVSAIQPVRQALSTDAARNPTVGAISGTTGLPLWLELHNSGGTPYYAPPFFSAGGPASSSFQFRGDLYNFWGDSTMGWQDGVNWTPFLVWEDRNHTMHPTITSITSLVMAPFGGELQKSLTGVGGGPCNISPCIASEDVYFGLYVSGPNGLKAYPWIEARLAYLVPWAITQYGADVNRIYGTGHSMGGWGTASWSSKQSSIFAAIYPDRPRWVQRAMPTETGWSTSAYGSSTPYNLPSGTPYVTYMNQVVNLDCGVRRPPMIWDIGRNDGYSTWTEQWDMIAALTACHFGFAVAWDNGSHDDQGLPYKANIADYAFKYKLNESYPAFTHSSLDDDLGTGSNGSGANRTATTVQSGADGACASSSTANPPSCVAYVNRGWSWTIGTDTSSQWTATISNYLGAATVEITPQNTQAWNPLVGQKIHWSTTNGQSADVVADAYRKATALSVTIPGGGTTITFSPVPPVLTVSPTSLSYTCTSGGAVPGSQSIAISLDAAGVSLDQWTATKTQTWMSLSPSSGSAAGSFSATVDCSGLAAGSYSDTITVTSSTSGITGSPKTIAVSVTAVAGPAVSTTTLPSGKVSLAYSQTLTAIGGQTPYTWSVVSGSLCAGLALNASTGAITGAPTVSGTCSFTVRVSDTNLATGDKPLSIVVVPLPHPIPSDVGTRRLIIR